MNPAGLLAAGALGTAVLALVVGVAWLRRRYTVAVVSGPSMRPTLTPGDRLLVRRATVAELHVGQIVVFRYPHLDAVPTSWLVKRVAAAPGDPVPAQVSTALPTLDRVVPAGRVVMLGDNPDRSTDSRHYGYVDGTQILGVALRRLRHRREEEVRVELAQPR